MMAQKARRDAADAAIAWAESCTLLCPPMEALGDLPKGDVVPSVVEFDLKRGVPTCFSVRFGCYNAHDLAWKDSYTSDDIKTKELPKLFALLDHFQGPFQAWGHFKLSGMFTPLIARDAEDAKLLERFVNAPDEVLGGEATPPNDRTLLFPCPPPFDLDISQIYERFVATAA